MKNHEFYLRKCLNLAVKGFPKNKPNPMVGCIIVCNGKIIGTNVAQGAVMTTGDTLVFVISKFTEDS